MISLVLMPVWILVAFLVLAWAAFAYQTRKHIGFGRNVIVGLLMALALKVIAASATAIATSKDPISEFACLMGVFGSLVSPIILLIEVAVLVFVFRFWPQSNGERKSGFGFWLSIWFVLNLIAFLSHVRSAALCTV